MSRYIDADELLTHVKDLRINTAEGYEFRHRCIDPQYVYDAPTVDAVPVVHGHWIDMGDFEKCSACKATRLKEFNSFHGNATWIRTAYCPYCGASMDG